jgi:hypothetical protein
MVLHADMNTRGRAIEVGLPEGRADMTSVRVGFTAKDNGFHFANRFPTRPIRRFKLGNVATLDIGDAANGLCGGMSFTARDLFEHKRTPPPDDVAPDTGALHDYIVNRQIDSFEGAVVPLRFFTLMSPIRPDREPMWAELAGRVGVDRHSRTYVMIHEEWPAIKRDLDEGHLSMMGLVRMVSLDPNMLGHNHQVVAYGYDLDGSRLTLHIYDPNYPRDDSVTLSLDISDPRGVVTTTWSRADPVTVCFFRAPYQGRDPGTLI